MPAPALSIIVPCYNEEKNLPGIVSAFSAIIQQAAQSVNVEVLLVNNGSTDGSAAVLQQLLQQSSQPGMQVVNVPVNQGYGDGILAGLAAAKAPLLAWTHADLQTDPLDVMKAWELFQQAPDEKLLVKGKRVKRKSLEAFFTWGMQLLANAVLRTRLNDINAQPKLFSRVFYERIKAEAPPDFSLDVYFLYHAKKTGIIKTIPVEFRPRLHGEAKGGGSFKTRMKLIRRTFKYLFTLRKQLKSKAGA
jgi:glycosyltransferase involved in cell wall biosynthesis